VRGTGTAALIVTHNQLLAEQMDDILTISQGRIVRSGS
jgi:ABC-type lipoprotein export system ATPase subunit